MATLELQFEGPARARFVSDFGLTHAVVYWADAQVLTVRDAQALAAGVRAALPHGQGELEVRAAHPSVVVLCLNGVPLRPAGSSAHRSAGAAWVHALLALAGSLFGFAAGWLYLQRAQQDGEAWSLKMAWHMAAWHLLLTLTLFPASLWGQRAGIRAVQLVSLVFFAIHAGISLANALAGGGASEGAAIASLNLLSGLAFLATFLWGFRALRPR